jgi:hypothetical protein
MAPAFGQTSIISQRTKIPQSQTDDRSHSLSVTLMAVRSSKKQKATRNLVAFLKLGSREWTRTIDPHHVKVVL